jgi:hypothetical protein
MWFLVVAGVVLGAILGIYFYGSKLRKEGIIDSW